MYIFDYWVLRSVGIVSEKIPCDLEEEIILLFTWKDILVIFWTGTSTCQGNSP